MHNQILNVRRSERCRDAISATSTNPNSFPTARLSSCAVLRRVPPVHSRRTRLRRSSRMQRQRFAALIRAVRDGDERTVEDRVRALSQSRRIFAPLAFAVDAFVMLFDGVKLLVLNWRLALVQLLPAMWIWIAMYDLKGH